MNPRKIELLGQLKRILPGGEVSGVVFLQPFRGRWPRLLPGGRRGAFPGDLGHGVQGCPRGRFGGGVQCPDR